MPVGIELNDGQRVVIYQFGDPWTVDEVQTAHEIAFDYYQAAPRPLCFLVDCRQTRHISHEVIRLRHSTPEFWHPMCLMGTVVGAPDSFAAVLNLMGSLGVSGVSRFKFVETMDEAWALLDQAIAAADASL